MNVPKPKVSLASVEGRFILDIPSWLAWFWSCPCGADGGYGTYALAMEAAREHSRTHTAERIADRLDEWAGRHTDSSSGGAYWEGYLEGAALAQRDAALLVRRYLVGGAS